MSSDGKNLCDCQKASIKCLGQFGALLMPSCLVAYQTDKLLVYEIPSFSSVIHTWWTMPEPGGTIVIFLNAFEPHCRNNKPDANNTSVRSLLQHHKEKTTMKQHCTFRFTQNQFYFDNVLIQSHHLSLSHKELFGQLITWNPIYHIINHY